MTVTTRVLPELSSDYTLSEAHIAEFQKNGHILLHTVCTPTEAAAYAPVFREAVAERSAHLAPLEERDAYGQAFIQIMNLWTDDERCRRFVFAQRFAKIAAQLMGVPAVRLYHDQALFKEPGGSHTPWHQDQTYWPLETDTTVTMWMPLVDITQEMGTMDFASGSHNAGYLGESHIEDQDDPKWEALIKGHGFAMTNHGAMKAGDATFHAGFVLHDAPSNTSERMREVMTVIYFPDGTMVLEPDNPYRQNDLDAWIPGGIPGQPVASRLNPVLFPSS